MMTIIHHHYQTFVFNQFICPLLFSHSLPTLVYKYVCLIFFGLKKQSTNHFSTFLSFIEVHELFGRSVPYLPIVNKQTSFFILNLEYYTIVDYQW